MGYGLDYGKIFFRNKVQSVLYTQEYRGQFSDGHWENSSSMNWTFWCGLDVGVNEKEPGVFVNPKNVFFDSITNRWISRDTEHSYKRNRINFPNLLSRDLLDVVASRMLFAAKFTLAHPELVSENGEFSGGLNHWDLPESKEEAKETFQSAIRGDARAKERTNKWTKAGIDFDKIEAVNYTMKDMLKDIADMRKIMKNIVKVGEEAPVPAKKAVPAEPYKGNPAAEGAAAAKRDDYERAQAAKPTPVDNYEKEVSQWREDEEEGDVNVRQRVAESKKEEKKVLAERRWKHTIDMTSIPEWKTVKKASKSDLPISSEMIHALVEKILPELKRVGVSEDDDLYVLGKALVDDPDVDVEEFDSWWSEIYDFADDHENSVWIKTF